jgi:hypothetical protein
MWHPYKIFLFLFLQYACLTHRLLVSSSLLFYRCHACYVRWCLYYRPIACVILVGSCMMSSLIYRLRWQLMHPWWEIDIIAHLHWAYHMHVVNFETKFYWNLLPSSRLGISWIKHINFCTPFDPYYFWLVRIYLDIVSRYIHVSEE